MPILCIHFYLFAISFQRTDLYLQVFDAATAEMLVRYCDVIGTLAYSNVIVSDSSTSQAGPPEGCAIVTVSSHCTAHLMLKGKESITKR